MCGLFGLLRSTRADHPERASDAFVVLGTLAEERGYDSAGLALFTGRPVSAPSAAAARSVRGDVPQAADDISLDGCRVVKGRGRFSAIWRPELLPLLDCAPVAVGHTRWATQGSPYLMVNASPLIVDPADGFAGAGIVATHNGDIDAAALRARLDPPPAVGTTDSEPLFQSLAARQGTDDVLDVLTSVVGRAALAWVDRARPDRVHLARAALSPLTVAVDTEGNFFWASNPRWLRDVERHTGVRFAGAVMLREGTYLRVARGPHPQVIARADFRPTARRGDRDDRVWTGFTDADRELDRSQLRHRVAGSTISGGTGEFATV